jgi:hypothetical protein
MSALDNLIVAGLKAAIVEERRERAKNTKPTLTKITAADGSKIAVTTRIDADGLLRVDVFSEKSKTTAVGTVCISAKAAR